VSIDLLREPLRWKSASFSDIGNVRSQNEDACLERPDVGVWLVADGMGGHEGGAFASKTVVEAVMRISPKEHLGSIARQVRSRLRYANRVLREEGRRRGRGVIGSTVAVLLLHRRHSVCIWAGDSRIYRLRGTELRQLTRDHRWVEEYVAEGLMTRAAADRHPLAHELTRALGAENEIELAVAMQDLLPGDRFLLCSDGLYGEISERDMLRLLAQEDPRKACEEMVQLAKHNGARDNVTAVAVSVMHTL
jgi:serine/threonine protein phosphatase PrpC